MIGFLSHFVAVLPTSWNSTRLSAELVTGLASFLCSRRGRAWRQLSRFRGREVTRRRCCLAMFTTSSGDTLRAWAIRDAVQILGI